jgi:hypothetical protein
MMVLKTHIFALSLAAISLWNCEQEETKTDATAPASDTVSPVIAIIGKKIDTAYLYAAYQDQGAGVLDDKDGIRTCTDFTLGSEITGSVNTRLPGTYFLNYNASDAAGNPLATVTRTVHVVENSAGFLNGNYNVISSCTAVIAGSSNPTVTTENYTATVTSGIVNDGFELSMLKIGTEYVTHWTSLKGNAIDVRYFSLDYHQSSTASGTLSATKNTFTIESKAYLISSPLTYQCENIYTKQLIEVGRDNK